MHLQSDTKDCNFILGCTAGINSILGTYKWKLNKSKQTPVSTILMKIKSNLRLYISPIAEISTEFNLIRITVEFHQLRAKRQET